MSASAISESDGATSTGGGQRTILALAFIISGASALTYQICWNRLLFSAIGVDLDSTTIVVSAFMLGLGVGSALGGWIAARFQRVSLGAFCAIEIGLLACGLLSADALTLAAIELVLWPRPLAAFGAFVVLLPPTVLMGATLPLMTAAATQRPVLRSIGFSGLYIGNTFGAAAGSFLAGFVLIGTLGLRQTLYCAAVANLLAALTCAWLIARLPRED